MKSHTCFETKADVRELLLVLEKVARERQCKLGGRIAALIRDKERYAYHFHINSSRRYHLGRAYLADDMANIRDLTQQALHDDDWETCLHGTFILGEQWLSLGLAGMASASGKHEIAFFAYLTGGRAEDAAKAIPGSALHQDVCAHVREGTRGLRALSQLFDNTWINSQGFAPAAFIPLVGALTVARD